MLIAYMDESGIHDQAQAVVVGGLVGDERAWLEFEESWRKSLTAAGVSCYHATDLESYKGEYRGWSKDAKVAFQMDMIKGIRKVTSYGVVSGVSLTDFSAVIPSGIDFGSPYMLCVMSAVLKVVEWAKSTGLTESISFVFESGGPERGEIVRWVEDRRRKERIVGSLSFGDKRTLPLSAADFYAYEGWKYFENNIVNGEQRDIRKSLQAIVDLPHMDAWSVDRDGLEDLLRQYRNWDALRQGARSGPEKAP